jgi:phosphohistidine phosphatase
MIVVLFRHGPAEQRDAERWSDDRRRPLTERGAERTRAAARGLARILSGATQILTSPLLRCRDTAEILRANLEVAAAPELLDSLAPEGSFRETLRRLQEFHSDETVIVVGHEPDLGKLAGVMLFGAPAALPLKKAGACALSFEGAPRAGSGVLQWFLPPRTLRALGRRKSPV